MTEFLSVDEAAALLRIDRRTIYDAVKRDEMPGVVRIGRVIRIRRDALGTPAATAPES